MLAIATCRTPLSQQFLKFIDVDTDVVMVEPVAIAFARHRLAEEAACVADRLVEALAASLWVVAWPERFENLIALGTFSPEREERDQLESASA